RHPRDAAGCHLRPHAAGTLVRILSVVGARPNFMKLAPVDRELAKRRDLEHVIVHTGQHYDPDMSDLFFEELWIPAPDYLLAEGIPADRVHFVGNVMIDSLCWALPQAVKRDVPAHYDVAGAGYAVVTLHRPANVDDPAVLRELLETLDQIGRKLTVLFPVHPRTRERVHTLGFQRDRGGGLRLLEPLGYLD